MMKDKTYDGKEQEINKKKLLDFLPPQFIALNS
jgi:hypothetical protein